MYKHTHIFSLITEYTTLRSEFLLGINKCCPLSTLTSDIKLQGWEGGPWIKSWMFFSDSQHPRGGSKEALAFSCDEQKIVHVGKIWLERIRVEMWRKVATEGPLSWESWPPQATQKPGPRLLSHTIKKELRSIRLNVRVDECYSEWRRINSGKNKEVRGQ